MLEGQPEGLNLLKMPVQISPETMYKFLRGVPPIKTSELINPQNAVEIRNLLSKVSSLAHFSRSMADFFARDDALEPALAVVCEVLRDGDDIGSILNKRAATFLSLAQPYDKHRSSADRDVRGRTATRTGTATNRATRRSSRPCFRFQRGECQARNCNYTHECTRCGSSRHGNHNCKYKSRKSSKRRSERRSENNRA